MGSYVSNMIGIRTGGVFSGKTDLDDLKGRVAQIIAEMRDTKFDPDIADDPSRCMSNELKRIKVLMLSLRVFSITGHLISQSEFSKRLSKRIRMRSYAHVLE